MVKNVVQKELSEIGDRIKQANNILVIGHQNPDPDAYGSSCGLVLALNHMGKNAFCLNQDSASSKLFFIPNSEKVLNTIPTSYVWDLLIFVDCGEKKRVGDLILKDLPSCCTINLDHHYSNSAFCDYNFINPLASSASEIVFELVSDLIGTLTKDIAECLLAGIIADTGGFRYSSTTAHTFSVAEKLVKAGADVEKVNKWLFSNKTLKSVDLKNAAIGEKRLYEGNKLIEFVITEQMLLAHHAEANDCDGLAEFGRDIQDVYVSVLIRKDKECWKVSMRSKFKEIDVSEVAQHFGGGGHHQAAAFRWYGELNDFREKLISEISMLIKQYNELK